MGIFEPLSRAERQDVLAQYLGYLRRRDGAIDYQGRTLSRREERKKRFQASPARWQGPVDAAAFHRNHAAKRPEPRLDPLMLWLLATAKANRGERYGVEAGYRAGYSGRSSDPCEAYVETEEFYHSQILADVVRDFGIEMQFLPPGTTSRLAINSMVHLPSVLSVPVILCAEAAGCAAFQMLLDKGVELTASQPAVQARVRELFGEILTDEIGHVVYCRARMGALGLSASRVMMRGIVEALISDIPEFLQLFPRQELLERIERFDVASFASACLEAPFWPERASARAAA